MRDHMPLLIVFSCSPIVAASNACSYPAPDFSAPAAADDNGSLRCCQISLTTDCLRLFDSKWNAPSPLVFSNFGDRKSCCGSMGSDRFHEHFRWSKAVKLVVNMCFTSQIVLGSVICMAMFVNFHVSSTYFEVNKISTKYHNF